MVFSDTTSKTGLVQKFEFWTRQPYGSSGDLLKTITELLNSGFDSIMPLLLSYSDYIRWDDFNHSDRPTGTINLFSGQSDYTVTEDDNALDILNLTSVRVIERTGGTEFKTLERMYLNDPRVVDAISPNPSIGGTPTHFVEQGNTVFLYPEPNYSVTNGIKLMFEREQSRFISTDTTKEPGIPKPFHELLVLHAALDWVTVNRPKDGNTINKISEKITRKERELSDMISMRNPTQVRMSVNTADSNR